MGQDIREAIEDALRTGADLGPIIGAFFRIAHDASKHNQSQMLEWLDVPLRAHPPERTANLAVLAGAFVEIGADPKRFPRTVFDRLGEALGAISGADDELPEWYFLFERAAMAYLSSSPEARRTLPQKVALIASLRRYQERYGFLGKMLQVLDGEPLVVIHPKLGQGFRFVMHGIADNFQLHVLLLAALAGEGPERIPGELPSADAVAAASDGEPAGKASVRSSWQLANWFALRDDGELDVADPDRSWIWNEGVPADIAALEGTRVVLLGPSTIQRGWNAHRVFPGMPGKLEGPIAMDAAEVRALLAKMKPS